MLHCALHLNKENIGKGELGNIFLKIKIVSVIQYLCVGIFL